MKNAVYSFFLSVYNIWCVFWLLLIFLILFPFIWICIQRPAWHPAGHKLVRLWSVIYFFITAKNVRVDQRFTPSNSTAYVFVANHFSYLDVAVGMNVVKNHFSYMGKSSVKKIPLLGYVFAKLHIQVDRGDKASRSKSLVRAIKALKSGRSIFIMPEGGILSKNIPKMLQPFKDGAFVMAIENQVPIVPITFLNLYRIMPESKLFWGSPEVIIHPAIETTGKSKADIEELKKQVYEIIQGELDRWNTK
jgi:1-acyl-sn-glycerol-3-phosphate acyltransferase